VLLCVDPDVPSSPDSVNKDGMTIAANLPRVDFIHWVMVDIPAQTGTIDESTCSDGVIPHGKSKPNGPDGSRQDFIEAQKLWNDQNLFGDPG